MDVLFVGMSIRWKLFCLRLKNINLKNRATFSLSFFFFGYFCQSLDQRDFFCLRDNHGENGIHGDGVADVYWWKERIKIVMEVFIWFILSFHLFLCFFLSLSFKNSHGGLSLTFFLSIVPFLLSFLLLFPFLIIYFFDPFVCLAARSFIHYLGRFRSFVVFSLL